MEYPFVKPTNAGDNLLALTNGDPNNSLVLDKAVFSNQPNDSNEPLEDTTLGDFVSPLFYKIQAVKHNENTMQPEVTLDNKNFKQDYPVYMIGVLGHAQNDTDGNETLCAVAVASNDPLIMPKASDNDYRCTFALPIGIDNSKNVKIVATDAGTVSYQDFDNYRNTVNTSLSSNSASASDNASNIALLSSSVSYNSSNINSLENDADDFDTLWDDYYSNAQPKINANSSAASINGDEINSMRMDIYRLSAPSSDPSSSANKSMLASVIMKADGNSANIDNLQGYVSSFSSIGSEAHLAKEQGKTQMGIINKVATSVGDLSSNVSDNIQNISTIQQNMGNALSFKDLSTISKPLSQLSPGFYFGIPNATTAKQLPGDHDINTGYVPILLIIFNYTSARIFGSKRGKSAIVICFNYIYSTEDINNGDWYGSTDGLVAPNS